MACTRCGRQCTLVYSSLLNGNLCNSCYDECIEKARSGELWKEEKSGVPRRETEIRLFDRVRALGLERAFIDALKVIIERVNVEPFPDIHLGKKITVKYKGSLRKSLRLTFEVCTPECGYKTSFVRAEMVMYGKYKDSGNGVKYVTRYYFYPNGKIVRKQFKEDNCGKLVKC